MKINAIKYILLFALMSFAPNLPKDNAPKDYEFDSFSKKVEIIYNSLDANNNQLPKLESFSKALEGFYNLKEQGFITNDYLTIVDFTLSSKTKRLWVIDMNENKIVFNSLVAHGRNSGNLFAKKFSNSYDSYKSSLGFYATGEVYYGTHGMSLKLDGLEKGINDNARKRAVVLHGAEYVSKKYIKAHKFLGRSEGCPAIPMELSSKIIKTIKNKSCLFIYYPNQKYLKNTKLIS